MKLEREVYDLKEVAQECHIGEESVLYFISQEWVSPESSEEPIFDEEDIARMRLIHELKNELGVNDEAVPVILHLVDQLNYLHLNLDQLKKVKR